MRTLIISTTLLFSFAVLAQKPLLEYDRVPGLSANYKPAYNEDYPDWAKMLYHRDINVQQLDKAYQQWDNQSHAEHKPIERYYKIWRRAIAPYVNPDGSISLDRVEEIQNKYYKTQKSQTLHRLKNNTKNDLWSFVGPGETFDMKRNETDDNSQDVPWQVNVYFFDVSKQDKNVIYAGTETGYINKTINAGETWQLLSPNYPFGGAITSLAIDPHNDDIVYVSAGSQIHKTIDGGQTWEPQLENFFEQFPADKIIIHPNNSNHIIAAGGQGIYISQDAGDNWRRVWNNKSYDLHFNVSDPNTVYAISQENGFFCLVVSNDGGQSFFKDPNFPSNIVDAAGGLIDVRTAVPDQLYAIMLSEDNTPHLYRGNMNTGRWQLLGLGRTANFPMDNGQGFFDLVLEVGDGPHNIIFVGTTTLYKSADGGRTFNTIGGRVGPFPIHADIQCMQIIDDQTTWVSTDGGFTLSTDLFTEVNNADGRNEGLIGSDMWGFDQAWNEDLMVGGRYHNGNVAIGEYYHPKSLYVGGAESATGWIMKGNERHATFDDLGAGFILPASSNDIPEGRFPFSLYPNMDEFGSRRGNIFFHPNYHEVLYLGNETSLWKSEDMGESFQLMHNFGQRIHYCDVAYSDPNIMYADIRFEGLYRSADGGLSWERRSALTDGTYAPTSWAGRLHFAISPTDANTIYACYMNTNFNKRTGGVYRSQDGGLTWEDISGDVSETKMLAVQPDRNGEDIIYLFTNNQNGNPSKCYVRRAADSDWTLYGEDFPAGMVILQTIPFFKDSKIRVAGNAGVWEAPLLETDFQPILQPWAPNPLVQCGADTIQLEDHSILNHENASWTWTITPTPEYIENPSMRNPKVVFGAPGTYDIRLQIRKNGRTYAKTIQDMIEVLPCPSLDNCSRPALIPKNQWSLEYVDSEELNFPGLGEMAFDDDVSTIWHSEWFRNVARLPHEIQVNLGDMYRISEFTYYPRQDNVNGRIADFEIYVSDTRSNWGAPIHQGTWVNNAQPKKVTFATPISGRYLRLVALSEVNGEDFTTVAEMDVRACYESSVSSDDISIKQLRVFPVPTTNTLKVPLPNQGKYHYSIYSENGQLVDKGINTVNSHYATIDMRHLPNGLYVVKFVDQNGTTYMAKSIKSQ